MRDHSETSEIINLRRSVRGDQAAKVHTQPTNLSAFAPTPHEATSGWLPIACSTAREAHTGHQHDVGSETMLPLFADALELCAYA